MTRLPPQPSDPARAVLSAELEVPIWHFKSAHSRLESWNIGETVGVPFHGPVQRTGLHTVQPGEVVIQHDFDSADQENSPFGLNSERICLHVIIPWADRTIAGLQSYFILHPCESPANK